jgi:hypothetical protein
VGWERVVLLGRREIDDSCTIGWERAGLLGGRELDDLVGEGWAAGQERG